MRTITVPELLRPKPGGPVEHELKAMAEAAGLRPDVAQDMLTARKVQLLFVFLRYSPTYELARKVTTGELQQSAVSAPNFVRALETYGWLGPVRDRDFKSWWQWAALPHILAQQSDQCFSLLNSSMQIAKLERRIELLVAATAAPDSPTWLLGTFSKGPRKNGYTWPRLVAADAAIRSEVARIVDARMLAEGTHDGAHASQTMMSLSRRARDIREVASARSAAKALKDLRRNASYEEMQQRASIKPTIIRELKEAQAIAENAARGSFPLTTPVRGAFGWKFHQLRAELYR